GMAGGGIEDLVEVGGICRMLGIQGIELREVAAALGDRGDGLTHDVRGGFAAVLVSAEEEDAIAPDGAAEVCAFAEPDGLGGSGCAGVPEAGVEGGVLIGAESAAVELVLAALERDVGESAGGVAFGGVIAGGLNLVLVDELGAGRVGGEADAVVGRAVEAVLESVEHGAVDGDGSGAGVVGMDIWVDTGDDEAGRQRLEGEWIAVDEGEFLDGFLLDD